MKAERRSYFTLREWLAIITLALISTVLNAYLPIKGIMESLGISGPAAGMALLGGIIFVLPVCLAFRTVKKRYSGIITAVLIAAFCMLMRPWYGITSPIWFGIYAIAGFLCLGLVIELMEARSYWWGIIGGGLGNLSCLAVAWLAIGIHTSTWVPGEFAPPLTLSAVASGCIGTALAHLATRQGKPKPS